MVDPLDGTYNYAAGVPLFAVMAAAVVLGEVVMAAIHDPMGDDTSLALRGEGAWIEEPTGPRTDLRVAAPAPLAQMTAIPSWQFLPEPWRDHAPGLAGASGGGRVFGAVRWECLHALEVAAA